LKTKYKTFVTREEAEKKANYLRGRGYWTEIKTTPKGKYRVAWNKEPAVYAEKGKRAKLIEGASREIGRETRGIGKSYGRHFARSESDFDITKGHHPIIGQVYDEEHMPRIAELPKSPW
jgi:hypothetical protein